MLMGFYGLCLALILVMRFGPATPFGAWLNRNLVEEPLKRVAALERHHLIFFVVLLVMALGAGEAIAVYGSFEWAMISLFDASVYLDALLVTMALGAKARLRGAVQILRARVAAWRGLLRPAGRPWRLRSASKRTTSASSANDDDPAGVLLVA